MKKLLLLLMLGSLLSNDKIAVIDLFTEEDISNEISANALIDRLTTEIFNLGVYQVLERKNIKNILDEYKFQLTSGAVNQDEAIELGSLMGAKYIVLGSISQVGNLFSISVRMVDVETSLHYKAVSYDCPNTIEYLVTEGMHEIAMKLSGLTTEKESFISDSKEVANWITHTPKHDKYIYSIGIGKGLEGALLNSLSSLCKEVQLKSNNYIKDASHKGSRIVGFNEHSKNNIMGNCKFGNVQIQSYEKKYIEETGFGENISKQNYYSKVHKLVYKREKDGLVINSSLEIIDGELKSHYEKVAQNCELSDVIKALKSNGFIINEKFLDDNLRYHLLLKVEKSKLN